MDRREFDTADAMFAELLATAADQPPLTRAFTLQHAGRSQFDRARYAAAAEAFAAALAIRERVGAPADQISSSRDALAAARRRMEQT